MKLTFKSILYVLTIQLLISIIFVGCRNKPVASSGNGLDNWPYNIEGVYGTKVFLHNPADGIFIDTKERKITKLFDSKEVNATRVQGSTLVDSDISPDYKNIVFRFDGGDVDLIDKNKGEDELRIYDIESKKIRAIINEGGYNAIACWSKDGSKYIFTSDRLDGIYIYDVKSGKSEKIERPKGKLIGNITYIQNKYIICNINNSLYQYSDKSWNRILDNWEGKVYVNSLDNCYLIDNKQVSKLILETRQVERVYSLPVGAKEVQVYNNKDIFAFSNESQLHIFNTLDSKERLFKIERNLGDFPVCSVSPKLDKVVMRSYEDKIIVVSLESFKVYEYNKGKTMYLYPAVWYNDNSLVLIDGEDVRNSKIFDIKTEKTKALIK